AAEEAAERVAKVAAAEVDRMVRSVRAAVDESLEGTAAQVHSGLSGLATSVETTLTAVLQKQEQRLSALQTVAEQAPANAVAASQLSTEQLSEATAAALLGIKTSTERLGATQERLLGELHGMFARTTQAACDSQTRLEAALQGLGERQAAASEKMLLA